MTDEIASKLSAAPARLFPEAWARLVALRGDDVRALDALDRSDPGMLGKYRQESLASNVLSPERRRVALADEEAAALAVKLGADFLLLGASGQIVGRGLYEGTGAWQDIPAELWTKAKLSFTLCTFTSDAFTYSFVSIRPKAEVAGSENASSKLLSWLQARQSKNGAELKKTLFAAAVEEFGGAVTVRAFDAAYAAVYDRRRGRPAKKI